MLNALVSLLILDVDSLCMCVSVCDTATQCGITTKNESSLKENTIQVSSSTKPFWSPGPGAASL